MDFETKRLVIYIQTDFDTKRPLIYMYMGLHNADRDSYLRDLFHRATIESHPIGL